ncbi:MAG: DNA starvation/stationary phase protection protein Dps [Myxococcales bacterium]|nr:DNA starvation/stationary phase protection protein Dps [Myxococcales bacterium]
MRDCRYGFRGIRVGPRQVSVEETKLAVRHRVYMNPTKNDLPETTRRQMIELNNALLADAIDLQTQTKQAHWNVKGPQFIALHELFDKVNADVEDYVDLLAERAVQLGGEADGTARSVAKRSSLPEYPLKSGGGRQHVDALSSALATFGKRVRGAIDESSRANDQDTNDILIEISRGVDKWLWMVEAHLHPEHE